MRKEETYGKEDSKDKRDSGGHPVALEEDKVEVEAHLHHYHQGRVGWGLGHLAQNTPKKIPKVPPKTDVNPPPRLVLGVYQFLYLTKMHAT